MWEPTPWVVGGGAEHSPEVARVLAYASTSGAEGIVTPGDLKVSALPVAGGAVRVAPGAALIRNRYAGGGQQTYAARNTAAHDVEVAATGSGGGRTDLVVARIVDPQYAGEIPDDPTDYQYVRTEVIQGVPAGTTRATDLNLGYPALALARIAIPASTATIAGAMITDLRKVALPRKERELFSHSLVEGEADSISSTTDAGESWPDTSWYVDVPEWATGVDVVGMWSQALDPGTSVASGRLWAAIGDMGGTYGQVTTQIVRWTTTVTESGTRSTFSVSGRVGIPVEMRGRRLPVYLKAMRTVGTQAGGVKLDSISSVSLDLEFFERAD